LKITISFFQKIKNKSITNPLIVIEIQAWLKK